MLIRSSHLIAAVDQRCNHETLQAEVDCRIIIFMIKHNFKQSGAIITNARLNKKTHKYGATKTISNGYVFDSKKEAEYYETLHWRQKVGDVLFFLRQIPFHFEGNIISKLDFMEFCSDGEIRFVETKGFKTKDYIRNKKLIEARYPIEIIEV